MLSVAIDLGVEDDDEEPVPLPNVNAAILRKVIAWCTYHKDDPPPPEDDENKEKRTDDICSWDAEFLKVDQGTLFELILVRHSFILGFLYINSVMKIFSNPSYHLIFFHGGGGAFFCPFIVSKVYGDIILWNGFYK